MQPQGQCSCLVGELLPLVPHYPSQDVSGTRVGGYKGLDWGMGCQGDKGQAGGWKGIQGPFPT